jgi:hypothetical protein
MFQKKKTFCMIILLCLPVFVFGIDSDLKEMNYFDNEKSKASSPLFTTRAGYAYSEWKMPGMNSFKQETQGLNLAWIDLIYKSNRDDVDGNRNYLHYERSFNKNWNENVISQEDVLNNEEVISGKITFPFKYKGFSSFIKGSKERYLTQITSKFNTKFIDKSGGLNSLTKGDNLVFETKFNEIALGIDKESYIFNFPLFAFKDVFLFFDDYQKPFTIRQYSKEVEKYNNLLFYSQMKSYGLGFTFEKILGNFYLSLQLKMGQSKIDLKDSLGLADNLHFNDSSFSQSTLKMGYSFSPIKSLKELHVHILGVYSHRIFDENLEGDNVPLYINGQIITIDTKDSELNNDEIKKLFVSLQYSF